MRTIFVKRTTIRIPARNFRANTLRKAIPQIRSKAYSTVKFKFIRLQLGEFPPFRFKVNLRRSTSQVPARKLSSLKFKFARLQLGGFPPFRFKVNLRRSTLQVPAKKFAPVRFKFIRIKTDFFPNFRFKIYSRRSYINSDYLLADWFGSNASQDKDFLYIKKADFQSLASVEQASLSLIIFALIQLWASNQKPGRFSLDLYRNIQFLEENQNYLKQSYLLELLSNYNSSIFPSPHNLR